MSIHTKYARLLMVLAVHLLPFSGRAQEEFSTVQGPGDLRMDMPNDPALQAEIDKVLGMTEGKIKKGIVDPGVDLANLMVNKALDEMIKAIADAVVVAPAAEKIMSIYQKTKDKRLVKKLASLREVWKDGQERLNKLNYQDFKLRYEWAKQHNEENLAIKNSAIKDVESRITKELWPTEVSAIQNIYDRGSKGSGDQLAKRYLNKGGDDFPYYNLSIIMSLGGTDLIKARNAVATSKGKPVFLSPYERLQLQRRSLEESRQRHQDLTGYSNQVNATMNYYRMAESEQAIRSTLSKTISDPYLIRYSKK